MEENTLNLFKINVENGKLKVVMRQIVTNNLTEEENNEIKRLSTEIGDLIKVALERKAGEEWN